MTDTGELGARQISAEQQLSWLQRSIVMASLPFVVGSLGLIVYASTRFGAHGFETGVLVAVGELMTALARPLIGSALDRIGRKPIFIASIAMIAVGMVFFAFADNVWWLLVARTLHGFGNGVMLLAAYAMTADYASDAGRGSSFGRTEQSQYRGGLLGAFLAIPILIFTGFNLRGELLITGQAWGIMFAVYAVASVAAAAIAAYTLHETHTTKVNEDEVASDERKINPQLYVLMSIVFLTTASVAGIGPFVLKFIQDHISQNLLLLGIAYLPASVAWAVLPARLGHLADRFGRKAPMVTGLTVSGVFSAVIPLLTTLVPLSLFATLEAICFSAAVPAEQAMVADMTGGRRRGVGFGLYTFAQATGRVVGPLLMGLMYDVVNVGPFLANFVILMIGSLLVWFVLKDPAENSRRVAKAQ